MDVKNMSYILLTEDLQWRMNCITIPSYKNRELKIITLLLLYMKDAENSNLGWGYNLLNSHTNLYSIAWKSMDDRRYRNGISD